MDEADYDTVLVAGASGDTGRELLRVAGPRVPTVRAMTRSPGKRDELLAAGADEVVVENLLSPADLPEAVAGADAVLSAVGSGPRDLIGSGPLVDGTGTVALLEAAVEADVEAFVMESAIGVGDAPASPLATAFDLFIGPIQDAKTAAEDAIREAPVRHTVLRPGILTGGPRTDDVTVAEPGSRLWGAVSRADVARLMVAAPITSGAADRTFEVVSTPSLRGRGERADWRLPARTDAVSIEVTDGSGG